MSTPMNFTLTDEQELLLESVREWAARTINEDVVREAYANHGMQHWVAESFRDAGFGLIGLPEKYGGVPCDNLTKGLMMEELYHSTGAMFPFVNNAITLGDIVEFGSEDQARWAVERYMETGWPACANALSEPGAGSDNKNMSTTACIQPDGTYRLNGQKTWVTLGETAPYAMVIAKDEDPSRDNKEMSLWLVPTDTPGVSTSSLQKIGQQCVPFCDMFFDDVVLTEDMRVGEKGKGFYLLMKKFEPERCLVACQSVGLAQAALEDAAKFANERVAFEQPITHFQLIQEKLTEMETSLQNARNMLYKTFWQLDNGISIRTESALLKRYATRACTQVASEAMAIFGGLGYTTETRVGRIWIDCRGIETGGGTPEIMVHIAGRQIAKQYKA